MPEFPAQPFEAAPHSPVEPGLDRQRLAVEDVFHMNSGSDPRDREPRILSVKEGHAGPVLEAEERVRADVEAKGHKVEDVVFSTEGIIFAFFSHEAEGQRGRQWGVASLDAVEHADKAHRYRGRTDSDIKPAEILPVDTQHRRLGGARVIMKTGDTGKQVTTHNEFHVSKKGRDPVRMYGMRDNGSKRPIRVTSADAIRRKAEEDGHIPRSEQVT